MELKPPLNVTLIRDLAGLAQLQDFFSRSPILGWDIETTPVKDYFWRRIRTIQFGNQQEQYVIDLRAFCGDNPDILRNAQGDYGRNIPPSLQPVLDVIRPVVCSKAFLKIGVNLGFEYLTLYWNLGLRTWNFFDCSLAEKCIYAGAHSMKDYSFYSMEEMMGRYFGVQIDKELQESFTLECDLTPEQIAYAALDTRFPIALRQGQLLILQGETIKTLQVQGRPPGVLKNIDPLVTGDNLMEIVQIENDCIGAFQDMHAHGERLDRKRWRERIARKRSEFKQVIVDLDVIFLPLVGSKTKTVSDADIEQLEAHWKSYNVIPDVELQLKSRYRQLIKIDTIQAGECEQQRIALESARKQAKEYHKKICSDLKKRRTVIKNLADKCEGDALINYASNAQLLAVLAGMKGLTTLKDLEDETLEKFERYPVMAAIRKYHGLAKEIGTYGDQWAIEWVTHPCKEEGWLHPGDGRLHCIFNQYDAETGRSTSEKPNGQNLPQDKEVRSCFIADPPNESIRISCCCDAETQEKFNNGNGGYLCLKCERLCDTKPEEYVIITADMSGAELRIIAELANDPIWIDAFARGEDVHSVGTEILYPDKWPLLALPDCRYFALQTEETVAANPKRLLGEPQRQKCKCPEHNALRNDNKATNFLLAYGGGPATLAARIKKTLDVAREIMAIHAARFPKIWEYLDLSGRTAQIMKKAFDMFGRRRLFPEPTWDRAKLKAAEDREEKLRLDKDQAALNKSTFTTLHNRKPNKDELWLLTHRLPTNKEVGNAFKAMHGSIERQGKNHCIQGTNATVAKKAMGCGYSPDGQPYLWHTFPQYKARLIKFVHDELVVHSPKRFAKQVAALIGDAFKRAAAEKMTNVIMEFDYNIAFCWQK